MRKPIGGGIVEIEAEQWEPLPTRLTVQIVLAKTAWEPQLAWIQENASRMKEMPVKYTVRRETKPAPHRTRWQGRFAPRDLKKQN